MDNTNLDIITVFNPDSKPFHIVYDNKSYGTIDPGKARRMPRFLAKLSVKHLIDQCLNSTSQATSNQVLRDQWAAKIVIDEEVNSMAPSETPDDKLNKELDQLNKNADLDRILHKHRSTGVDTTSEANFVPGESVAPVVPMQQRPIVENPVIQPPIHQNEPASLTPSEPLPPSNVAESIGVTPPSGENKVLPEVDNVTSNPPTLNESNPTEPTREQLYTYAEKTLGMTLSDKKTKDTLDLQGIPELIKTLGYESPTA